MGASCGNDRDAFGNGLAGIPKADVVAFAAFDVSLLTFPVTVTPFNRIVSRRSGIRGRLCAMPAASS